MSRTLRSLGLGFLVMLAVGAATPALASAEFFYFTSSVEHTTLKGATEGISTFVVDGGTTECKSGTLTGTATKTGTAEVKLSPTYSECTSNGGLAKVEVKPNSCTYLLASRTKEGTSYEAEIDIECAAGDSMTVIAEIGGVTKCTVHIGAQTTSGTVTVQEEGSPSRLKATIALTEIKYDQTAGTGLAACPTASGTTNGKYNGTAIVEGFQGETKVSLSQTTPANKIKLVPTELDFEGKGAKTKKSFQMKNESAADLEFFQASKRPEFTPLGKCYGKVLVKMGGVCPAEEEVECQKPKKDYRYISLEFKPFYLFGIKAKNC